MIRSPNLSLYYLNILQHDIVKLSGLRFVSVLDDEIQQNVSTDEWRCVYYRTCHVGPAGLLDLDGGCLASWSRARGRTIQNEWT
jgi:hypothetical protein